MFSVCSAIRVRAAGEETLWGTDLQAALRLAEAREQLVLVLVQQGRDLAAMDAGRWFATDPALRVLTSKLQMVRLAAEDPALRDKPFVYGAGLLLLTAKGRLVGLAAVPDQATALKAVIWSHLEQPLALLDLLKKAAGGGEGAKRAVQACRASRLCDLAARVLKKAGRAQVAGWGLESAPDFLVDEVEAQAPFDLARRLERVAEFLGAGQDSANARLEPVALENLFGTLDGAELGQACEALLVRARRRLEAGEGFVAGVAEQEVLRAQVEALREEARIRQSAFVRKYPEHLPSQLALLRVRALEARSDERLRAALRKLLNQFLNRPFSAQQLGQAAPMLAEVAGVLEALEEQQALAHRLRTEAEAGRGPALACCTLADAALRRGSLQEARELWKAAHKLAAGESPVLAQASGYLLTLAEGKSGPNRSPWARRRALDLVVLVQDWEAYLRALSRWSEKTFFPILFADDWFAPRFVAAYRPERVLWVPRVEEDDQWRQVTSERVAAALWRSWTEDKEDQGGPTVVGPEQLKSRLRTLGIEARGVVVGSGQDGEWAGGLALAAGRFQGLERLEFPRGTGQTLAAEPSWCSAAAAAAFAVETARALAHWRTAREGEEDWPALTLAGHYPYLYSTAGGGPKSTPLAVDDLLGRTADGARQVLVGRLRGERAQSVYQAMCSLFLSPQQGLFVDGFPRRNGERFAWHRLSDQEVKWPYPLEIERLRGEGASLENLRRSAGPWNRRQWVLLNALGDRAGWLLGAQHCQAEDLPAGEPALFILNQPHGLAALDEAGSLAGRALGGGGYWASGVVADPGLHGLQAFSWAAPLIAQGAPFAAALRQYPGQPSWQPGQIMVVGDPLYALRSSALKRRPWDEDGSVLVREGETWISQGGRLKPGAPGANASLASWTVELRRARWAGDREAARQLLAQRPAGDPPDGAVLAMALEEDLMAGQTQRAARRLSEAGAVERDSEAVRWYAALIQRLPPQGGDGGVSSPRPAPPSP